jgi:hypothetical protein
VAAGETDVLPDVPEAVKLAPTQPVALVELHMRVDDAPLWIDAGFALNDTVGFGPGFGPGLGLRLSAAP